MATEKELAPERTLTAARLECSHCSEDSLPLVSFGAGVRELLCLSCALTLASGGVRTDDPLLAQQCKDLMVIAMGHFDAIARRNS